MTTQTPATHETEVTPGPHKFLTPVSDPGPKEKRRILPEKTPPPRIHGYL